MTKTEIEWASDVWNPTTGCDRVSPGCDRCYALTMAKRLKGMGSSKYQRDGDPRTSGPGFGVTEHPDTLELPFRWRKPKRVFVNSMSDLFHDQVTDEFITQVWAVMTLLPQHTFQILTKRHGRMRSLLKSEVFQRSVFVEAHRMKWGVPGGPVDFPGWIWPLRNVWLGVSVEDQKRAELRISALEATPAAVRFLSCEPLIGPLDVSRYLTGDCPSCGRDITTEACGLIHADMACDYTAAGLSWVIVGGESGPGARPMHPDWARSLRDQCTTAGVPYFFKQWGEWAPAPWSVRVCDPTVGWTGTETELSEAKRQAEAVGATVAVQPWGHVYEPSHKPWSLERVGDEPGAMRRVGKKVAGRELDGRTWDEFPDCMEVI